MTDSTLRWWQRGIVYQIYPRSFMDASGDGVGDLEGIRRQLDYLYDGTPNSLGVDAIWISPFYPSPMADFGYDVADYVNVDPLFGDLAAFDRLVEEAHRRGLKVIIDWVPNHTSDQHRWFVESRSSRDNPKRDWYIWRDAKPDGSPPNNWGSMFGGSVWEWDEHTGQYYFHQFVKGQPDLNWRNPEVRRAMYDTLRFWLARGVDGFRIDVIYFLLKHPDLPDQPLNPDPDPNLPPNDLYWRQQHPYDHDAPGIQDIVRDIRKVLDEYGDTVGIGELWLDLPRWVKYYGENGDGLHLPFNFRLIGTPFDATAIQKSVDEFEAALPPFGWPNYVLGNHDMPRLASRYGGQDQARVAAMLLLTLRGTPTLYQGDEIGLENGVIPPEKIQDPQGINLGAARTRDVCRTPMQWDGSAHAGFSPTEPWLPVSADYTTRNVAAMTADPRSILSLYRKLIWYRRGSVALYGGSYQPADRGVPTGCYAYLRQAEGERRFIALNFTDQPQRVGVPGSGRIALSTHLDRESAVDSAVELRPFEGVIIELT